MNAKWRMIAVGFIGMLSLVGSGCGQAASTPTPTLGGTSTASPTIGPTGQPTGATESLADAKDLPVWLDDYVHAYGGSVAVNGATANATQLMAAVKADPGSFIKTKTIGGLPHSLFVVNSTPIAIQDGPTWRAILARDLSDAANAEFAMPVLSFQLLPTQPYNPAFIDTLKNANMLTLIWDLDTAQVFKDYKTDDWRNVLNNWTTIKAQLDAGQVPGSLTYNWWGADYVVQFAHDNHMALRAGSLVWNGDVPDSLRNGGFSKEELLKLLEFTSSVKVIKYKGVMSEWDAGGELVISEFSTGQWGFWSENVGILDAARMSASIIRKYSPQTKITIGDDHELEQRFYDQQPDLWTRFMKFATTLKGEGLIDRALIENNLWIHDLPDQAYMESCLRQIQAAGIGVAAPEIDIFPTKDYPFWAGTRQAYNEWDDPLKGLAEAYRRVVQAYLNVGAKDIGLGDVGDAIGSTNYTAPGSNTTLFDTQWKPKMAWYEVLKVMYAAFLP